MMQSTIHAEPTIIIFFVGVYMWVDVSQRNIDNSSPDTKSHRKHIRNGDFTGNKWVLISNS
jgi:hypothetical protein